MTGIQIVRPKDYSDISLETLQQKRTPYGSARKRTPYHPILFSHRNCCIRENRTVAITALKSLHTCSENCWPENP
mgnify:CR=1 FL=1